MATGTAAVSDYNDLVAALSPVSAALNKLGIRHYVGGSVASSFHGASRSTKRNVGTTVG